MSDAPPLIHRYAILQRLGRGGMGEVFLAHDPTLDRQIAIKVLLTTELSGEELRDRFALEARAAARLTHSNIVTIYDVGQHSGQPYIAMEYVDGETLFKKIQRRAPLPLATKLKYIDELCAGLGHAHKAGIVHRDIKPINLIVSADDILKILDFGIARLGDSNLTQSGVVMGTLNYMSPEQVAGQPVDHRSDIFAVGAVCYELLSYQQAFPGRIDTGVLGRIMEGAFTPLAEAAPGLDERLIRIVNRALAKDPAARYADLGTMRAELAQLRTRLDARVLEATVDDGESTIRIGAAAASPAPPRATPRRGGMARDEIQKRREDEIASSLANAREAFDQGRFEDASAACERVLVLEPDHDEAIGLNERARAAIEQHQIRDWLAEGRDEFAHGNFTRARDLAAFVLSLDASSTEARELHDAVGHARQGQDAEAAVARGRAALQDGDAVGAIAAALDALRADPESAGADALRRDADRLLADQRRHGEHDRRARNLVIEARRRFPHEPAAAIALLQAFAPPHVEVSALLRELRAIRDQESGRAREVEQALRRPDDASGPPAPAETPPPSAPAAVTSDRSRAAVPPAAKMAAAAVLVIALGGAAWQLSRGDDPSDAPPSAATADSAVAEAGGSGATAPGAAGAGGAEPADPPPGSAGSAPPSAEASAPPAAAPPVPSPSPAAAPPPTAKPAAPALEEQLEPIRREARQFVQRNQPIEAAASVEKGLRLSPGDAQLLAIVAPLLREAQETAAGAKLAAISAGGQKFAEPLFNEGVQKEAEARGRNQTTNIVANLRSLGAAADLFNQAASRARAAMDAAAADARARQREAETKLAADAKPADADARPKEPARVVETAPAARAPAPASDEDRIRETLGRYEAAYERLDVGAVRAVYPGVPADQLADAFRQYRTYELDIAIERIEFAPSRTSAVVSARVTYAFQPVAGRRVNNTASQRFTLQKDGAVWRIEGIR